MKRTRGAGCLVFLMACSGASSSELGDSHDAAPGALDAGDDGGPADGGAGDAGGDGGSGEDAAEADSGRRDPELDADTNANAVNGLVLGSAGEPLANVTLRIGAQTAQTDATGHFTSDVRPPFDIAVIQGTSSYVFLDVGRLDPTLHLPTFEAARGARIAGRVEGGELVSFPLDATTFVHVTFAGAPGFFSERLNPGEGANYGPFPVTWSVGDSVSGYLVAVAARFVGNGFSDPVAVAVSPLALRDGVDMSDSAETRLTLSEPATRAVQVDISLPEDYEVEFCQKALGTYTRGLSAPGAAFQLTVVDGLPADLKQNFYCELRDSAGRALRVFAAIGAETALVFEPPSGVRALAPLDGAPLPADGAFTFTPQADAVSFVDLSWSVVESGGEVTTFHNVQIATDGDSVPLARLAALGIDISPAAEWSVSAQGSWDSLDAYLGPDVLPAGARVSSADLPRSIGAEP